LGKSVFEGKGKSREREKYLTFASNFQEKSRASRSEDFSSTKEEEYSTPDF